MWKNNLILILYPFLFLYGVKAMEWSCASSTNIGTFTRSTDCTISGSDHVDVSNTLEIVGSNEDMNNLITITAATNQRHFYLNNANAILTLRFITLTDGNPLGNVGGAIHIDSNGGTLHLYNVLIVDNEATLGGGIYSNKNGIINIYNTNIMNNRAIKGGGIHLEQNTIMNVYNSSISKNEATSNGGGIYSEQNTIIEVYNSTITERKI